MQRFDLQRPGVKPMLLLAIGSALLPLWLKVPAWVGVASALVLLSATNVGSRLPRWLLILSVLAATVGVVMQHRGLFTRDAGLSLIVLMASFKLLELKSYRDAMLVSALSFFLTFVGLLFYQSLSVALYLFLLLPLHTATVLVLHRLDGWRGLLVLAKDSGRFVLLALPLVALLYVFFPRLSAPLWRLPGSGVTGPTDSMTIGDVQSLALSDELAFRVKFTGAPPPEKQRYWRGTVLADFDGLTWNVGMPQAAETIEPLGAPIRYQIALEPTRLRWLYALDVPQTVDSPLQARRTWNATLLTYGFIRQRVDYSVESVLNYRLGADATDKDLATYLRLPDGGNPQSRQWAEALRARYPDATAYAQALLRQINQDNFWYSLQVPELSEDTVDDFWFNHKRGYCEHYANAVTFLLRAGGVPARVVVGYQGGEWNPYGNFLTVRHLDAHAWLEFWRAGDGWIRLDPTAAVSPLRIDQSYLDRIARRDSLMSFSGWDSVATLTGDASNWALVEWWQQANRWFEANVVQFNADAQRDWLENLGLPKLSMADLVRILVIGLLLLLAISAWLILRSRPVRDPVARLYAAFCAKLARAGIRREPHETPQDFLRRAQRAFPAERGELRAFVDAYIALRYGAGGSYRELAQQWRRLRWRRLKAL
ncbi:MAG: transglutaminase TgpA family protein [Pseudomonadota bacterium]